MCIIFSKPANIEFPSILTLRNCWENNPHGAGYVFAKDGHVFIRKGFMTWEEFIENVDFNDLVAHACVFHFRYATHGSVSVGNCHPFPATGKLKAKKLRTDVAIAHNGVIRNAMIMKDDYSDTMTYIETNIRPFWTRCQEKGTKYMYYGKKNQKILLEDTKSKWSFLFGDGTIINVGTGFQQDGIWYSNGDFQNSLRMVRGLSPIGEVMTYLKAKQFAASYCDW